MKEIEVIGRVILSDKFSIKRIDLPSNRKDNLKKLQDMGVSDKTLDGIQINNGTEDIVGRFLPRNEQIAFEAKGTTKNSYSNFKYWGKGILNQMAQIDDKTDAGSVGIAIPSEVSNVFRGILSSHHSEVSDPEDRQMSTSEAYGDRQTTLLRNYSDNDYVVLVHENGVQVQSWVDFFGL